MGGVMEFLQELSSCYTTWLALLVLLAYLSHWYLTMNFDVFNKQGIKGHKPYPLIGTTYLIRQGLLQFERAALEEYGNVYGGFKGRSPNLYISDEEMLKEILVKQFHNFTNRSIMVSPTDKITKSFMTGLVDNEWKRVRHLLTPTFSTGKLKQMTAGINACSRILADNIAECAKEDNSFHCKEYLGAFTMDAIARTAFGIEVHTQTDPNNVFVKNAKRLMDFKILSFKTLFLFAFPGFLQNICQRFGYTLMDKQSMDFFTKIIIELLEEREKGKDEDGTQSKQPKDFLQLMLDAHKENVNVADVEKEAAEFEATYEPEQPTTDSNRKGLTHDEVLAQGILFFLAGYENVANTMMFLFYNLAVNQDWQEKVYQELCDVLGEEEGDIDYRKIGELQLLDNFVQETLRIHSPSLLFDRHTTNDITIKGVHIPAGCTVSVPIGAIHYDPKKWPNPEQFDPERFNPEARAARSPFHFMPFGYGPRNCIAMRLALVQAKLCAAHVLRKCRIVPSEDTQIPMVLKREMVIKPEKDIMLKAELRHQ